jgi:Tfp pilus assembly protein PilX
MRIALSEEGAALVTALMLTMLSLVIAMALLYTVTAGTRISASQKRYHSALAATHGGVELVTQEIIPALLQASPQTQTRLQNDFSPIGLNLPAYGCLQQKLSTPTANWGSACSQAQTDGDPSNAPDMAFTLGGASDQDYSVAIKIVDTVPGNTDTACFELLDPGSSVAGKEEVIRPQHVSAMFNIAVQGVGGSPREKARLSLLYAY